MNFNIFGGFQKYEYFWGMKICGYLFGRRSQNWTIIRGHFYAFRVLSLGQGTEWGIVLALLKFQINIWGA